MFDISICIPTYNRAGLLRQCLEHLFGFCNKNFEIVVGDNASNDDTPQVVDELGKKFAHFSYLRHRENLGFARNMDSLLRCATRKFVYILNDDDFVFEEALGIAISIMNANDGVVAIVGRYLSLRSLDSAVQVDYATAVATVIKKGAHAALLDNLSICDGHPILRRETFERHCAYLDRTGTLIPLYFSLLHHGDIVAVDKPFFQHRTTSESLTGRMAEAWFLDMANADIELAISQSIPPLTASALLGTRQQLLQLLYFQAARMSFNRKASYLLWLFLRRLIAVEGAPEEVLLKSEYHFSHDFLIDRISTIVRDAGFSSVYFTSQQIVHTMVEDLARELTDIAFVELLPESMVGDIEILLVASRTDEAAVSRASHIIALDDLFGQLRLTARACRLVVNQGRIVIQYDDPAAMNSLAQPSPGFNVICTPYSETL